MVLWLRVNELELGLGDRAQCAVGQPAPGLGRGLERGAAHRCLMQIVTEVSHANSDSDNLHPASSAEPHTQKPSAKA